MDVRCERCNTEYEFDDALVSGRGTTVKCTSCGHKFRIRRADGDFSEDYWNVRTRDGRTLVFTSLRELQRAIQARSIGRTDELSRGGLPPKPIVQIPELAAFFDGRDAAPGTRRASVPPPPPGATGPSLSPPRPRQSTRPDFPPPPAPLTAFRRTIPGTGLEGDPLKDVRARMGSIRPSEPPATERDGDVPSVEKMALRAPPTPEDLLTKTQPFMPIVTLPDAPSSGGTARPPADGPAVPAPAQRPYPPAPVPAAGRPPSIPPPLPKRASVPSTQASPAALPAEPAAARAPSTPPPLPAAARPRAESEPSGPEAPVTPPPARDAYESRASVPDDAPAPSFERRAPVGGYVVAAVVALGVVGVGVAWMKAHGLAQPAPKPVASVPAVDPRVAGFLASGEQALAGGDLEVAKESFDKASALAERDPRVLVGQARLSATRADLAWLKVRLEAGGSADEQRLARDELGERAQHALRAADAALAASPDDAAAVRAKVDALRISGDLSGARALVAKGGAVGASPEGAYVLAALDLAEPSPPWPAVLERLRAAAAVESGPGRARAALVFALARSGDVAGAKAELERLASMTRPHPLLPLLRAEVDRTKAAAVPDAGAAAVPDAARVEPARGGEPRPSAGGGASLPSDPRVLVAQGDAARAKGDYEKARTMYSAALEKSPSDSEALHGLAAIAHAQHDVTNARNGYRRVLAINPSYLPSLLGLADLEWESGDRATAVRTYKEIADRFPDGAYPARVKQRTEAGGAPKADEPAGGGSP